METPIDNTSAHTVENTTAHSFVAYHDVTMRTSNTSTHMVENTTTLSSVVYRGATNISSPPEKTGLDLFYAMHNSTDIEEILKRDPEVSDCGVT